MDQNGEQHLDYAEGDESVCIAVNSRKKYTEANNVKQKASSIK